MKGIAVALSLILATTSLSSTAFAGTGSREEQDLIATHLSQANGDQKRKIEYTLRQMKKPFVATSTTRTPGLGYDAGISAYGAKIGGEIPEYETTTNQYTPTKYIVVNIPAFKAYVVDNGRIVIDSKVIVGKGVDSATKTPTMSTNMTHIAWNPYWAPPYGYNNSAALAGWKRNPDHLRQNDLVLVRNSDHKIMSDSEITESMFTSGSYTLAQTPGDDNMLGKALFFLDNKHDVYMHDTNNRSLFANAKRNFSLGCIRVENWLSIASWALGKSSSQIRSEISTGKMTFHTLPESIPVFVVYWPVDVENGQVVYYDDLYNWVR